MSTITPCGEPVDLQQIMGQEHCKRGIEVAVAGGHAVLLTGAPEAGKTILARALLGLLPPLSEVETAEITVIQALIGPSPEGAPNPERRPCVAISPDASKATLYGGGANRVRPGAVSRAHGGVLLLDDLPA